MGLDFSTLVRGASRDITRYQNGERDGQDARRRQLEQDDDRRAVVQRRAMEMAVLGRRLSEPVKWQPTSMEQATDFYAETHPARPANPASIARAARTQAETDFLKEHGHLPGRGQPRSGSSRATPAPGPDGLTPGQRMSTLNQQINDTQQDLSVARRNLPHRPITLSPQAGHQANATFLADSTRAARHIDQLQQRQDSLDRVRDTRRGAGSGSQVPAGPAPPSTGRIARPATNPADFYEQLRDEGKTHAEAVLRVRAQFPHAVTATP